VDGGERHLQRAARAIAALQRRRLLLLLGQVLLTYLLTTTTLLLLLGQVLSKYNTAYDIYMLKYGKEFKQNSQRSLLLHQYCYTCRRKILLILLLLLVATRTVMHALPATSFL
jgi:hypothetical protein